MAQLPPLPPDVMRLLHQAADLPAGLEVAPLTPAEQTQLEAVPLAVREAYLADWDALGEALTCPTMPHSIAAQAASDIALSAQLQVARPPQSQARSLAADLAADIALSAQLQQVPLPPVPHALASTLSARIAQEAQLPQTPAAASNPPPAAPELYPPHADVKRGSRTAPLTLVGSLIAGLLALTVTFTWSDLQVGAKVLRGLSEALPPTFDLGVLLLLGTSLLIATQPERHWQRLGGLAFGVAALLTLPTLYSALDSGGVTFGRDVVVEGQRHGPVIALGGDIHLQAGSRVSGEVLTVLGDIYRDPNAEVGGLTTALLGQEASTFHPAEAPGSPVDTVTPHLDALSTVQLATATAIRPLLGWLGGAAWAALFWVLTSALTLALFMSGAARRLAQRQAQAPLQTLALGVLALSALLVPATLATFAGWLAPALGLVLLLTLLLALGLGISAFDLGRQLACRLHVRLPDTAGVLIALALLTATVAWPSLTLTVILVGGAWGSGTLLLVGRERHKAQTA